MGYEVNGAATIISSIQAMQTAGQEVMEESFVTSREVDYEELAMGLGGNRFSRVFVNGGGALGIDYEAEVMTGVTRVPRNELMREGPERLGAEVLPFLFPSRYCESDRLREYVGGLFPEGGTAYDQVERVAGWIRENVDYVSGASGEETSALMTLRDGQGVCRDFAHLGIAFCRALMIPARYATMYAYRLEPQDFHACFEVYLGGRWCVFDATGLAPLNGMVRISTARDAGDAAVASLYGEIVGQEMRVEVECLEENFQGLDRAELHRAGEAIILA